MKTKICSKCKISKSISLFDKQKTGKYKRRSICKLCAKQYNLKNIKQHRISVIKHRKKYPWKRVLSDIKARCNKPNHKCFHRYGGRGIKCLITADELKKLWFRDKAYLMKRPSIDRKDNDGHYEYSNCQWIEINENSRKDKEKAILQYDLEGNFIREWKSLKIASEKTNQSSSNISQCLKDNQKSAGGFIWRYK